jgi:hypothetical protein
MKIVQIKNKYMFHTPKNISKARRKYYPDEKHYYAFYQDKDTKENRLVRLTHLYEKNKSIKIKNNEIKVEKFNKLTDPSGVINKYRNTDINNKPINLKNINAYTINSKVSSTQAKRVIEFAKTLD